MPTSKLLAALRKELKKAAVPAKTLEMQAYMKSKMPYHGVQTPTRRLICKQVFKDLEFKNAKVWEAEVRAIWEGARFREERYCALQLCSHQATDAQVEPLAGYLGKANLDHLPAGFWFRNRSEASLCLH